MTLKKINILAVLVFLALPAFVCAQSVEAIAYAPLKRAGGTSGTTNYGYEYISVHSRARLATAKDHTFVAETLRANGPHLLLRTNKATFGVPIRVRNDFFGRFNPNVANDTHSTSINITGNLNIAGYFYTTSNLTTVTTGVARVTGQNITMSKKGIELPASGAEVVIGNIPLRAPGGTCSGVGWVSVAAVDTTGANISPQPKILSCI